MNTDENSYMSNLIWVHIVCNIGYQSIKHVTEQTTIVTNGGKWVKEHVRLIRFQ